MELSDATVQRLFCKSKAKQFEEKETKNVQFETYLEFHYIEQGEESWKRSSIHATWLFWIVAKSFKFTLTSLPKILRLDHQLFLLAASSASISPTSLTRPQAEDGNCKGAQKPHDERYMLPWKYVST